MRGSRKLVLELLEGRALLSAVPLPVALASPPSFADVNQGLVIKLTTNQRVYRVGQPVMMTLTETNMSQHDINVFLGPGSNGFVATRDGRKVWASNAGIQPMFLVSRTVRPGESITLRATWNGHSNLGPASKVSGHVQIGSQVQGGPQVKIEILRS